VHHDRDGDLVRPVGGGLGVGSDILPDDAVPLHRDVLCPGWVLIPDGAADHGDVLQGCVVVTYAVFSLSYDIPLPDF